MALLRSGREEGDSFARASQDVSLPVNGTGPIATVLRSQEPKFIADAPGSNQLKRSSVAASYGIKSICFEPVSLLGLEPGLPRAAT